MAFKLFKKPTEKSDDKANMFASLLKMASPLLKMQGIDIQSIIPDLANDVNQIQATIQQQLVLLMALNDTGDGFYISLNMVDQEGGMNLLHGFSIRSIGDAMYEFKNISDLIKGFQDVYPGLAAATDDTTLQTAQTDNNATSATAELSATSTEDTTNAGNPEGTGTDTSGTGDTAASGTGADTDRGSDAE